MRSRYPLRRTIAKHPVEREWIAQESVSSLAKSPFMTEFADRLNDLTLFKQLETSASSSRTSLSKADLASLRGLTTNVAETVGPSLATISQTFHQYTNHDFTHCVNIIDHMGRFIPKTTLENLNGLEIAVLILAAILHDSGMVVSDSEKQNTLISDDYRTFATGHSDRVTAAQRARNDGMEYKARLIEDALLAEYYRRLHPDRVKTFIADHLKQHPLVFRNINISNQIIAVCESHAWGIYDSYDARRPERRVSALETEKFVANIPVNLQYLACCLRLADILDFDRTRTPLSVFQILHFSEDKSWEEWNKHLQIDGWTISEREVSYAASCTTPQFYIAVTNFLDDIDSELRECRRLIMKDAPKSIAERYELHLPPASDRWKVEMADKDYIAGAFRFQLDYERIMLLLMDKSLYPDPALFLRELLQNSLDACRHRQAIAKSHNAGNTYHPSIAVWDYSQDESDPRIIFQDNGMGMSRKMVEKYFMQVGRSYYRSAEFEVERARLGEKNVNLEATSQFGIGILSCFLVCDRFEVETLRFEETMVGPGHRPLHIDIEGPTRYFTIRLLPEPSRSVFPVQLTDIDDGPPNNPGTRITIHLKPNTEINVLKTIQSVAVNVDFGIHVYGDNNQGINIIDSFGWNKSNPKPSDTPDNFNVRNSANRSLPIEMSVLDDILVANTQNLDEYTDLNMSGVSRFWLLADEHGKPTPLVGNLACFGQRVETIGVPSTIGDITQIFARNRSSVRTQVLELMLNRIEDNASPIEPKFLLESLGLSSLDFGRVSRLIEWHKWSDSEQLWFIKWIECFSILPASSIYTDIRVMNQLKMGSIEWLDKKFEFSYTLDLYEADRQFALYGISVPAGFINSNAMIGASESVDFYEMHSMFVDFRGLSAPRPNASRLAFDILDGSVALLALFRGVLRHAIDLVSQYGDCDNSTYWRDWLLSILGSGREYAGWSDAVAHELDRIEMLISYPYMEDNMQGLMTRQKLVSKFGRWVPISLKHNAGLVMSQRPFYNYNSVQDFLLGFRPIRLGTSGIPELDMESIVDLSKMTTEETIRRRSLLQIGEKKA